MYFETGTTRTLIDTDTSSQNGAWGLIGSMSGLATPPDDILIRVLRKRIDRNLGSSHRHFCGGDSFKVAPV